MEYGDAKSIVDEHIQRFVDYLGLNQWRIEVVYDRLDDGTRGQCHIKPGYMRAFVQIDPHQADDIAMLLGTLRHEMIHILLWPMWEHAHTLMAIPSDEDAAKALDRVWEFNVERQVKEIEMMLDRAGECPCVLPVKTKAKRKKK